MKDLDLRGKRKPKLRLFILEQFLNDEPGSYSVLVVAAESTEEAIQISPDDLGAWCDPKYVECRNLGTQRGKRRHGIILAARDHALTDWYERMRNLAMNKEPAG